MRRTHPSVLNVFSGQTAAQDDRDLLALHLAGHRLAFETLVRRHGPLVLRVCRQILGDAHEAEDAFQATFLVLARKAGSIGRAGQLANWLYGVARRVSLRARARAARRRARERPLPELAAPSPSPPEGDLWAVVHEEVQRLPDEYRLPVVLCYLQGLPYEEAAARLGCPRGTIAGRLSRARDLLHARLCRRGVTAPAALLGLGLWAGTAPAAVPLPLLAATCGGNPSANILALTEGVLHAMFLNKLKTAALAAVVLLTVGGLVATAARRGEPPGAQAGADPSARTEVKPEAPEPEEKVPDDRKREEKKPEDNKTEEKKTDEKKPDSGGEPKERATLPVSRGGMPMAFSPDGKVLAVRGHADIRLVDVKSGKDLKTLKGKHHSGVHATLAFSPDGKRISSADWYHGAYAWDVETGKLVGSIVWPVPKKDPDTGEASGPRVVSGAVSADGRRAVTMSGDAKARVYDLGTGKLIATVATAPRLGLWAVALTPDGKTLAAMPQGRPKLWDVETGKELKAITTDTKLDDTLGSLRFSADGKTLLGISNSLVKVWRLEGEDGPAIKYQVGMHQGVSLSADGKTLALASSREKLALYDAGTGKRLAELRWVSDPGSAALSADGRMLASSREERLRIWEIPAAKKE